MSKPVEQAPFFQKHAFDPVLGSPSQAIKQPTRFLQQLGGDKTLTYELEIEIDKAAEILMREKA